MDEVAQGERRAAIIQAARELFTRRGYAAVSLGQIAEQVGVTKAALYNHFAGKEAVYTEMVCDLMQRITDSVWWWAEAPIPYTQKVRGIVEAALLFTPVTADMDEMMRDVTEHLAPDQQAQIGQAYGGVLAALHNLMLHGQEEGALRPDLSAHFLAHAYLHLITSFQGRKGQAAGLAPGPELVDLIVSLFLQGSSYHTEGGSRRE